MNRWLFAWRKFRSQIWVRASLYALFGCAAALAAVFLTPWVPSAMADRLGGESVEAILGILASSLLAVATFSLGAMVSAYTAVSQAASPRVAALVTSDESTQKSLATFVGAFLYAVVATTAVNARYYGPEGRAVLFLTSLAVVVLVSFRLLAWINRLSSLARLSHMVERVEQETAKALRCYPIKASLPLTPLRGENIPSPVTGYVQNVDRRALRELAEQSGQRVEIVASTGAFVRRGETLCRSGGEATDSVKARMAAAFSVDRTRTFAQDPRHGLIVLGEIAGKAMSPAVHDPGTAIEVIGVGVRLLDDWSHGPPMNPAEANSLDLLMDNGVSCADLLDDVFGPIIRVGLGDLQVAIRLHKALRSLSQNETVLAPYAATLADQVVRRAKADLPKSDVASFKTEFA